MTFLPVETASRVVRVHSGLSVKGDIQTIETVYLVPGFRSGIGTSIEFSAHFTFN